MKRLLLLALLVSPIAAQEGAEPEKPAGPPPAKEAEVLYRVELGSGSLLVGRIEPRQWKVLTKFGTLAVPIDRIKSVRFGRKSNPERYDEVVGLINDLSSANPDRRNHALAALKKHGPFAAPELARAARRHEDPEVRRRSQELLDVMGVDEETYIPDDDQIATDLFTVAGSVTLKSFKVTVAELGSLNIQRRDIVTVKRWKAGNVRRFKIDGQYAMVTKWYDTKIKVKKGQRFRITVDGTMHWVRWGNQVCTPDGNPNMGNLNGIWMGALCGRVGNGGQTFKIGRKYTAGMPAAGTLQLCVMMNSRNQPSSGEFVVHIEDE